MCLTARKGMEIIMLDIKILRNEPDRIRQALKNRKLQNEEVTKQQNKDVQKSLNYWLLENMKIMEKLTIKEPVSWSEQDWGG